MKRLLPDFDAGEVLNNFVAFSHGEYVLTHNCFCCVDAVAGHFALGPSNVDESPAKPAD